MNFRWSVVQSERANILVDARDSRIMARAPATKNLQGTVDDGPQLFGTVNLAHAGFLAGFFALIEQPRGMSDGEPAMMQIHLIVGEHETDPLVLPDWFPERGAPARVIDGDIVTSPGRAEPAHAVRQPRRTQAYLGITKTLADFAKDAVVTDANVAELNLAVTTGDHAVGEIHAA